MGYRELIKKIQHDAGFSDAESKEALDRMVESIAERLEAGERQNFASQLPAELQNIALTTEMQPRSERHRDIVQEFMEKEGIEEGRAKKQVMSAWTALKSFMSDGQINHVKAQLPNRTAEMLY
jgi:uncharacterized protein (DUF2267 family)